MKKRIIFLFFFVFVNSEFSNSTFEGSEAFQFLQKRFSGKEDRKSKIEVIPFGAFCHDYKAEVVAFGVCSSKYLRCTGHGGYRIESCPHGEVIIDGICQPALKSKTCFDTEFNQLNSATVSLATAIRACDGFPGIIVDSRKKCSRQGLVCDPSIEPTAFACPEGTSLDVESLSCVDDDPCPEPQDSTPIRSALVSSYCKYPPDPEKNKFPGFSQPGLDQAFCQDWFIDCHSGEFIFCESGKIYDKTNGYCRRPMAEDKCSLQSCDGWEWMRVPLGSCISEFVFCEGRTPNLFRCPQGRVFKSGSCLAAYRVPGCSICEPGKRRKARHCKEYFECRPYENPKDPWVLVTCPEGQFYNPQWRNCEKSEDGACADYGKCKEGESYNPQCGDYLLCRNGDFHPGRCPHLTRWSRTDITCVPDNSCKRYDTKDDSCRPGDVIPSTNCEFYFVCDPRTKTYEKRSCTDSAYENSSPCDYCRHSQPYKSPSEVSGVVCQEHAKFVDPTDCSRYVECVNSKFVERICVEGSSFDSESGRCSYKPKIRCRKGFGRTTSIFIPPDADADRFGSAFPPAPPPQWIEEREKVFKQVRKDFCDPGSPMIPDKRDCSVFLQCHGGVYKSFICPIKTFFNEQLQKCISDDSHCFTNSPICESGTRISHRFQCGKALECINGRWKKRKCKNGMKFINGKCSKTESCHKTHQPLPEPPSQYPELAYQDEKDCTRYYVIINGQTIQKQCNNGQKFDESIGQCTYSYNCNRNKPHCFDGETKPNPTNCEKYQKCFSGKFINVICPYGTIYDKQTKTCIEGTCHSNTVDHIPDSCTENPGVSGFRENKKDCRKFYQCANGRWIPKDCAPGTAFAPELGVCNHIQNVPNCARRG